MIEFVLVVGNALVERIVLQVHEEAVELVVIEQIGYASRREQRRNVFQKYLL